MANRRYISVILPLKLEWEPCYWIEQDVHQGDRVRVSFAFKEYIGVVDQIGIEPDIEPDKIKPVIYIEADMPSVLPQEIELWKKIAQYYLCTVGEVYKAAYPSIKVNMEHARAEAIRKVCQRRAKAVELIETKLATLKSRLEKKELELSKAKEGTKKQQTLADDIKKINEDLKAGQSALDAGKESLKAAEQGLIADFSMNIEDSVVLSAAQEKALQEIRQGFRSGKPVLLDGVTGSGKTEIYVKLAIETLKSNKNVLYLVPEIALSRQLEERLSKHFKERLITFHSGESTASRRNSAELIRSMTDGRGNYIALCTRSGIFLPHHNLGLIIVDEEHDNSYKQDSPAPRYNGRDSALMMTLIHEGCKALLGSATPSLEEIFNTRTGKHALVRLNERYHGSDNSEVEIIDTKAEWKKRGMAGSFSRKLIDHIREALNAGEQVLILRSRRAWASALQCTECGEIQKCPHCNVSMSLHKNNERMVCHYCGKSIHFSGRCAKCSGQLTALGAGTEKIEEETANLFPNARIARLDSDTSQNQKSIIKDFEEGRTDILIGTQMIGKGFDFSNLTVVAIIAADGMLGIQDFRADESAFQLMKQFRGRCGRREKKGLFIIQTSQPEHPLYQNLSGADMADYNDKLLLERKDFGFPPYSRILEISVRDNFEDRAERMAYSLAKKLSQFNVTGPYSPPVDKIADLFIRKIRICLPKDRTLSEKKGMIKGIVSEFEKERKYPDHVVIDVDPS